MNCRHSAALIALVSILPAHAQVATATVYGRVVDPSGAANAQAKVVLLNEGTNARVHAVSDAAGEFTAAFLAVGKYTISIEATGFKLQRRSGIELSAGQRVGLEYKLDLGSVSDVVEVSASTPQINTVSAEQREGKIEAEVRELPLARRDWTNMVGLGTMLFT